MGRDQWDVHGGLPVCLADRIVTDLLADREDESAVAGICQDAVHASLLDPAVSPGWPRCMRWPTASRTAKLAARLLGTAANDGAVDAEAMDDGAMDDGAANDGAVDAGEGA